MLCIATRRSHPDGAFAKLGHHPLVIALFSSQAPFPYPVVLLPIAGVGANRDPLA